MVDKNLISVTELAGRMKCKPSTARRRLKRGDIKGWLVGRKWFTNETHYQAWLSKVTGETAEINTEDEEITKLVESTRLKKARADDLEADVRIKKANAEIEGIVDKKALDEFRKKEEAVANREEEAGKQESKILEEWLAIKEAKSGLRDEREAINQQKEAMKRWMPLFEKVRDWAVKCRDIILSEPGYKTASITMPQSPLSKPERIQFDRWLEEAGKVKENQPETSSSMDESMFEESEEE